MQLAVPPNIRTTALYAIEARLRENKSPACNRKAKRMLESRPILDAIIMTVLLNCKMHGINPEEYFKDVLARLSHITATEARELTPAKWLAARQAQSLTA